MSTGSEVLKMALKRVDLVGLLVDDLLAGVLQKKLEELAAKSDNKLDDVLVSFLLPELVKVSRTELQKALADLAAEPAPEVPAAPAA